MQTLGQVAPAAPQWFLCAALLVGTAFAAEPRVAIAPGPRGDATELLVDRLDDSPRAASGLTLRDALERAARDPRENVIRCAPALLAAADCTVRIEQPLFYAPSPGRGAGRDCIEGVGRVTIQAGPAASAGLVVPRGRLALRNLVLSGEARQMLVVTDEGDVELQGCVLDAGGPWGMVVADNAIARLADTQIRAAGFANVDAAGQSRVALDACGIVGGARFGVLAGGNARLTLRRTTIANNQRRGLELQEGAAADLFDCSVERSGHFGIVLFGRSSLRVIGGTISRNRGHGLAIRDHSAADLRDCAFEENEYGGIGAPDVADGGRLSARRCLFRRNGMRPIFRGPMHIDPLVPTVARIVGDRVTVRTVPGATVDLYADPAGEASRYLGTTTADEAGEFTVTQDLVPSGEVIAAAATTSDGHTSEFNVVAGRLDGATLAALLARTGPLSDRGGPISPAAAIQRWRHGTRVIFQFEERPPRHVETYARWFVSNVRDWVGDAVDVDVRTGSAAPDGPLTAVVPIRYAPITDAHLNGTGGTTFTEWDALGYFGGPVRIFLARAAPGEHACPRVAVHEMAHALGLYHARVGLLSRMQGISPPPAGRVNDFSPAPTFFDVAALQILYRNALPAPTTLAQLAEAGLIPLDVDRRVAASPPESSSSGSPIAPGSMGSLSAPRATRR